jgi:flagellar hook-length control protein FliK
VEGQASTPPADEVEAPADAEVADAPKLQVKAEVKADQSITANAPEKRDVPIAPPHAQAAPLPDTTVTATTATAAIGTQATVQGDVRAIHSAYQAPSPINLPHVAFEIVRQVQQGVSRFQIRLDPPELGRVDVNLDMDKSGQVNAKLVVERSETLDLLQRDQRALERALAQAGLDTSKTNLEFSLRQNPFAGQDGKGQGQPGASPFATNLPGAVVAEAEPAAVVTVYRGSASSGGVNMFV